MKILVITYYWPPLGGGGVPRVVKFTKYLKRKGWEPIVLTIGDGNAPAKDFSFCNDVKDICVETTGKKIKKVNNEKTVGRTRRNLASKVKNRWLRIYFNRFKNFVRINFLIPDSKIFWLPNAYRKARQIIREKDIDIVFTTSPPYTVQLIGLALKRKFNLPWIADFRDPWTEQVNYNIGYRNSLTKKINEYLETKVLKKADTIVTVGENLKNMLNRKVNNNIKVIHNGYDSEDFTSLDNNKQKKFVIGYYGSMNKHQVPESVIRIISSFKNTHPNIYDKIILKIAGNIKVEALDYILDNLEKKKLEVLGYLSHDNFIKSISKEQVLLQLIPDQKDSEVIIGSKLYEYLYTGNPVLCLGSKKSEGALMVEELKIGASFEYENEDGIKEFLISKYNIWENGFLRNKGSIFSQFSRESLTQELIDEMENVLTSNLVDS